MKTTMDSAGRLVIPHDARRLLGLEGGEALEVIVRDGHLEIRVAATPMELVETDDGLVARPLEDLPPLTADVVREALDASRR